MFSNMANKGEFLDNSQIPFYIVLPAYITSELKNGISNWLPFISTFSCDRYGYCFNSYVIRNDDVVTNVDSFTI